MVRIAVNDYISLMIFWRQEHFKIKNNNTIEGYNFILKVLNKAIYLIICYLLYNFEMGHVLRSIWLRLEED